MRKLFQNEQIMMHSNQLFKMTWKKSHHPDFILFHLTDGPALQEEIRRDHQRCDRRHFKMILMKNDGTAQL